jgi:dCTP deaminase
VILSDTAILAAMERGEIVIDPFDPACLGGNSVDVHLSPHLLTYVGGLYLDCATQPKCREHCIDRGGMLLFPGTLYLGSTVEYTETHRHVPYLDGRSSAGRLGISIHQTAGRGDVGFCNHFTLEITVVAPVTVYAGMRIGQLTYHTVEGEVERRYASKAGATYAAGGRNPKPVPSGMWRSFKEKP